MATNRVKGIKDQRVSLTFTVQKRKEVANIMEVEYLYA
jgi:hypothetical protein